MTETTALVRGPAKASERAIAPDLARGLMLLMIVLANTPWYLYGRTADLSTVHPIEGSAVDRVVQLLIITFIDSRVYPMFAFLFGYGMVQLYRRQRDAGTSDKLARRLLRRRNLWLIAFGLVHAALLWYGDVLGAYGLAGLILTALFFRRRDKTLLIWAAVLTGLLVLATLSAIVGAFFAAHQPTDPAVANFLEQGTEISAVPDYLDSIIARLTFWPFLVLFQGLLTLVVPVALLLAFWAGRQRILEEPGRHQTLLVRVAVFGLGIAWAAGLVHGLDHLEVLPVPDSVFWVFSASQLTTGLLGGLGYVALFALVADRIRTRPGRPGLATSAITAVGQRSLSCYLAQSVVCAPLLAGWGFGLGAVFGSAAVALFAVGVWLLTVVLAYAQQRVGQRGPAERLLRRLVYGPRTA